MSSSYDDNGNSKIVVELDDDQSETSDKGVSKKRKRNDGGTGKKKAKPPKPPAVSDWIPGDPFIRTRKNSSPHWDHFVKDKKVDHAKCMYCETVVSCPTRNGTGTLGNHIGRCKNLPSNMDKKTKNTHFSDHNSCE